MATSMGLLHFDGYETKAYLYENTTSSIPDNNVNSIMEDSSGVLWISTERGFCRYNRGSETFTSFFPDSGQSRSWNNNVLFTREDSHGIIWVYTYETVFSFERETEEFTSFRDDIKLSVSLSGRHYSLRSGGAYLEDRNSDIWISDWLNLYKIDRKTGEVRDFMTELKNASGIDSISQEHYIAEDRNGNIWVTTFGDGAFRLIDEGEGTIKYYRHDPGNPEGPLSNFINRVQLDRNGELWFSCQNGFFKYNYESDDFLNYRIFEGPDDRTIRDYRTWFFRTDKSGVKWFVATRGIFRFDPNSGQVEHFFYDPDLPNSIDEHVNDIEVGDDGTVWISTWNSELMKWDGSDKPFHSYYRQINEPKGLKEPRIWSLYADPNNVLWLGTLNQGLFLGYPRQNTYDFVPYLWKVDRKYYSDDPHITWITRDGNGNFWLGSQDGLRKASPPDNYHLSGIRSLSFTRYKSPDDMGDVVNHIMEDSRGIIWIAMGSSIKLVDRETGEMSTLLKDPVDFTGMESDIGTIGLILTFEDRWGRIWIGTLNGGLFEYSPEDSSLVQYHHEPGDGLSISSDFVRQILEDKWGRLWLGTSRGLNLFNREKGTFIKYGKEAGLKEGLIMGLLSDDTGNLWISHLDGISKMILTGNDSCLVNPLIYNYDESDGIGDMDFARNAYSRSPTGEMYFGGANGFIRFHPDSVKLNPWIPKVYITSVHTEYCPGCPEGYRRRYFDKPVMEMEEIHLKSKDRVFSFEFTAISYTNAAKNQFAYMLEGFEEEWVYCGSRREVRYTNIDPGEYTFRVKASNNDGIWNEEGASLDVIIHPPWYRSILAYILYGLFILLAIYGYIRWRTYRFKKDKEILENEVRQRTATIVEQKEEILAANKEILSANTQLEEQKEELEQQTEELTQQKEELQITLDRLKETQEQLIQSEKLAALGGLVAGVAHEINTPVGISVTAASNLAEETKVMAEKYRASKISKTDFKEYLSTANQSAKLILDNMERTAQMVQSFKLVSADQSTGEKRRVVLRSYLEDIIRSLYPKLKGRGISIDLDVDPNLEIESYPGAVSQIFTNLILNSLLHGFEGREEGNIRLLIRVVQNELVIDYSDDGRGIPEDVLPRIFDPFFTTNKKMGTGLGLHIVHNLVSQKLNGSIRCESKPGAGAKFNLTIPIPLD
jgi:signal transduction histidine kinase/ligand-binding sensor domain-containing protein